MPGDEYLGVHESPFHVMGMDVGICEKPGT